MTLKEIVEAEGEARKKQPTAPVPPPTLSRVLRFSDLKALGIVRNWVTLGDWIKRWGFPPGRLIGPNTRVWFEFEIAAWLASDHPVSPKPVPLTEGHVSRRRRKQDQSLEVEADGAIEANRGPPGSG